MSRRALLPPVVFMAIGSATTDGAELHLAISFEAEDGTAAASAVVE